MITEAEFIHKCEFTCPRCNAVIRPSGMSNMYEAILRNAGQERADEIIKESVEELKKQHFKIHAIENMIKRAGVDDNEIEKLEKDLAAAISIARVEQRFGKAKIQFG
jgi:hypothetical protein